MRRWCTVDAPLMHCWCTVGAPGCRSVTLCPLSTTLGIYESRCSKVSYSKKAAPSAPHFFRRSADAARTVRFALAYRSLALRVAFALHSLWLYRLHDRRAFPAAARTLGMPLREISQRYHIYLKTSGQRSVTELSTDVSKHIWSKDRFF